MRLAKISSGMTSPTDRPQGVPGPGAADARVRTTRRRSDVRRRSLALLRRTEELDASRIPASRYARQNLAALGSDGAAKWGCPAPQPATSSVEVVKSVKAMTREALEWAISDAPGSTPPRSQGWRPGRIRKRITDEIRCRPSRRVPRRIVWFRKAGT